VQMDNIEFFANKLYNAIQQLLRKDAEDSFLSVKYNALFCGLENFLDK